MKKSGVKYYESADPERFVDILKEKEGRIQEIIPTLKLLRATTQTRPTAEVYAGVGGLKAIHEDIIKTCKNGDTVFVVYPEGVKINVGDGNAKGARGGFAVGGLSNGKLGGTDFLHISADSVRIYVDTTTYAAIGEGVVRSTTNFSYSILQSEVPNFRIAFPEDISILDVRGNDLRDWKTTTDKGMQYLDVYLNFGVKGNYILNVSYERKIDEGSTVVQIPAVQATGVEREKGYFGLGQALVRNGGLTFKAAKFRG